MNLQKMVARFLILSICGGWCSVLYAQEGTADQYPITVNTPDYVSRITVSHDGKYVMAAGYSSIMLYDAATGEQLQVLKSKSSSSAKFFGFARDNEHLIVSGYTGTFVVSINTEKNHEMTVEKFDFKCDKELNCCTAANKPWLLICTSDDQLVLIDYSNGKTLKSLPVGDLAPDIHAVFLSANGGNALVADREGVFLYDLEKGEATQFLKTSRTYSGIAFNHDGTRFAIPGSSEMVLYETKTGRQRQARIPSSGKYYFAGSQQLIVRAYHKEVTFYTLGAMKEVDKITHDEYTDKIGVSPLADVFAYHTDSKQFKIDRIPVLKQE